MTFGLMEMWNSMGLPAKVVGALLVTMGLASLTVFIERLIALRRSRSAGRRFAKELQNVEVSFEAGDIISQVMSFGSPTPIEVAVQGPALADNRNFAEKIRTELAAPAAPAGELSEGQAAEQPAAAPAEQPAAEPEREQ